jgi:iron complex transport system permease protein
MKAGITIKFIVLSVLFILAILASLCYGGAGPVELGNSAGEFIFREIRIPKTITAILAGCTLSLAGLILQILFRNPLAGPYVLGISSGAALMVAIGVLAGGSLGIVNDFFAGRALLVFCSVLGSTLVTFLILVVSGKVSNNVVLLLIGLMFSQICGAIQSSLEYFADPGGLKTFVVWGMGSLSGTTIRDVIVYAIFVFLCLGSVLFFVKPLNAFLLGAEYAQSLGIHFKRSRFALILVSSLLTGITTAYCGPIAFVGIAVPILSRMIFQTSLQQVHFFSCMLLGSILLLFADAICFSIVKGSGLPVNMITTLIGAPLVIYLMFKNKQW